MLRDRLEKRKPISRLDPVKVFIYNWLPALFLLVSWVQSDSHFVLGLSPETLFETWLTYAKVRCSTLHPQRDFYTLLITE